MAIGVPIAAAVIGAGATVYSVDEQKKAAEAAMANQPKMPGVNPAADESNLAAQGVNRIMAGNGGRNATVLAPPGMGMIPGSPNIPNLNLGQSPMSASQPNSTSASRPYLG